MKRVPIKKLGDRRDSGVANGACCSYREPGFNS